MLQSFSQTRQRLRLAAHNGVVTAISAGLFLIGAGFAVATGWIVLAEEWGAIEATGALGLAFMLLSGLVLLMRRPAPQPHPAAAEQPPPPPPRFDDGSSAAILLQAFLLGQRLAAEKQPPPRR